MVQGYEAINPSAAQHRRMINEDQNDPIIGKIIRDRRQLPVLQALEEQARALEDLNGSLGDLFSSLEPLLQESYPSAPDEDKIRSEPHSEVCGFVVSNTEKVIRTNRLIRELRDRLGA